MSLLTRSLALGGAAWLAGRLLRQPPADLDGKVVLITGGSRGLGLALAREFGDRGARLALLARNPDDLDRAVAELRGAGHDATAFPADVTERPEIDAAINATVERYGGLDVVVAAAGTIQVGPLDAQTDRDMTAALGTMFWGVWHTARSALRHLPEGGRIAVVSSIAGRIAVPHLVPYSVAKFAAAGFAEGLRTEVAGRGVHVTTVLPGLMRTGSHVNAVVKGDHAAEYSWFAFGATTPGLSISAEHAATRIVDAVARGDAEVLLGWPTKVAVRAHGVAPATTARALSVMGRLLPDAPGDGGTEAMLGRQTGADPVTPVEDGPVERHNQT